MIEKSLSKRLLVLRTIALDHSYLLRRLPIHGVLPCKKSRYPIISDYKIHLPPRVSTLMFSITTPNSTSDDGTEMVLTDAELEVMFMIAGIMSDDYLYRICYLRECTAE